MSQPSRKFWTLALTVLVITGLFSGLLVPFTNLHRAQAGTQNGGTTPSYVKGPFTDQPVTPTVFNGDLRDLPQLPSMGGEIPAPGTIRQPNPVNPNSSTAWVDPITQQAPGKGQMPQPIMNFEGLMKSDGGGWTPPDTNGDVGPNVYIQTVNIALGIYNKTTGLPIVKLTYNDFFQGPPGSSCDNNNRGDVVVIYDSQVDRWIVTDFSLPGPNYYECIAVSQTGDPVSGGWYFYELLANTPPFNDAFNDYPKLGVWADGWYMSANMFSANFEGVRVWALDRTAMMNGDPLTAIHFDCISAMCYSILPANIRGALPPVGSPEYFASVAAPNSLNLWQFHTDWSTPGNSTFTGPVTVQVADFQMADSIPQKGVGQTLDSLGDRMMFQLQYRNLYGVERLYANHSVNSGGAVGIRWYEIHDPGGTPTVFQQGTYQPDDNYRWMGSIAADGDGDIAVGYSISSSQMYPAIRYAGRLAGETPNLLTQNEAELFQGPGSQSGSNRWGDYSMLTIDPTDDCTFWYTQEYATSGSNWHTRIGSFMFPSCLQPKGGFEGYVYNSVTNLPVPGVPLVAVGTSYNFTTVTDASGHYFMPLITGIYDLTAGPLLPGYPGTDVVQGLHAYDDQIVLQDFYLDPVPALVHAGLLLNDPNGNGNGFPEPGEQGVQLSEALFNQGAITSTQITSKLTSLTNGVTVSTANSTYADIAAGETGLNATPYVFSIDPSVVCGTEMYFQATVTDSVNAYNTDFSLNASIPLPRTDIFSNTVENGDMGWTTGGSPNSWAITTSDSHSPTHSWTDSPAGNYQDNSNNYVRTPAFDLTGKRHVQLSGWFKWALETGFDYVYVEYSLNGGGSWNSTPLASFNGFQDWQRVVIDASALDNQTNIALRFHLISDTGVTADGIYLDDIALSYEPYECTFGLLPDAPSLVAPANGSTVNNPVTFVWQAAEFGAPAQGYIVYLDDSPVVTFTQPVTTTTMDLPAGAHTWFVKATNAAGASQPSATWSLEVPAVPNAPTLVSPANGSWTGSPVTFTWQAGADGVPAEGYILYIDETPVVTLTTPITTTTMDVSSWAHTWLVRATNTAGVSSPSATWTLNVFGKIFLPITRK